MGQAKRKEKDAAAPLPAATADGAAPTRWQPSPGLTRRGWTLLGAVIVLLNVPILHRLLLRSAPDAPVTLPYADDFSSKQRLHDNYWTSGGLWRLMGEEVLSPGVRNNPLWLKAKLPQNVRVEFDVRSQSPEGDIKCEIFGNGTDHASGYILIHGGWNNAISVIARLDEHGRSLASLEQQARSIAAAQHLPSASITDTGVFRRDTPMRVEANPWPVTVGKTEHWVIERRGSLLSWSIDGRPFMQFDDPFPPTGKDHDRFGFSSWEADLYFDNLKISPL